MFSGQSSLAGRSGFTLLEIVVSLAALGILMGAYMGLNANTRSAKLAAVVKQVNSVREAADKYIEATGAVNYTSLGTGSTGLTLLINSGYLPSSIGSSGSTPFGVAYAAYYTGSGNRQLVISISNLPDWARSPVANRLSNYGSATVTADGNVQVVF